MKFAENTTMIEYKDACILCGTLGRDTFCESCLPKVTSTGVCLLCRSRYTNKDPKFCDPCREELGPDSEAGGARFMRQLQRSFRRCSRDKHWLGLIPCYCKECEVLQPGWLLCAECLTVQSDNHICGCGEITSIPANDQLDIVRVEPRYLKKSVIRKSNGNPIHADLDAEIWKDLRKSSVGASDAMKLIKQNGEKRTSFATLLAQKKNGEEDEHFWTFDHGIEREPLIARWIQINLPNYELMPNRFVFGGEDIRHTATPDMVGPNYIAEIKTSTKPVRQTLARYYDQLQWQLHVTDYKLVLFVVENRSTQQIEHQVVERDRKRIELLVDAANEMLEQL